VLLAVDIGNTSISFGIFKVKRLVKRFCLPTRGYRLRQIKRALSGCCIDTAVISSVVPASAISLEKELQKLLGFLPYIIGTDLKVPIKNSYRKPAQVGSDRLVNAYAGVELYGAPLVVIDFGTAITFDVISKGKAYLGGMIMPGAEISLEALSEHTALLPKVRLKEPREFIGRDTKNSMLSGIFYGLASAADSLSRRIKDKIGKKAKVVGTGGNISAFSRYCREMDYVDTDLTLKGINLAYRSFEDPAAHCRRIK